MPRRIRRTYRDLASYFKESGDTQMAFAARIQRSQSWMSRVCNGTIEPNLPDALRISREAGVPLESLIKRPVELSGT